MCSAILKHKPDVVITEKGVADLTQHFLMSKGNVSIIRRVRKTDNNRIARVTGATIVHRPEDITEDDIGKDCGLFEVGKIGDDYFTYFTKCKSPSACTILFRGGSKDVLNEMERNFHDAIGVARNIFKDPTLIPGGGAIEMEVSSRLAKKAKEVEGIEQLPYKALALAFEIIPRTLIANCGQDVIRTITALRQKHSSKDGLYWGIDGNSGKICDMRKVGEYGVWEPLAVKAQSYKTAIETSCMLLRIDDVVSGIQKSGGGGGGPGAPNLDGPDENTFGDARDG